MLPLCAALATILAVIASAQSAPPKSASLANATLVYIGTRTGETSKGIYVFRLQSAGTEVFQNVTLVPLGLAAETPNPTSFAIDIKRRLLLTVNEMDDGAVSAFAVDAATGRLVPLGRRSTMGRLPCYLALDPGVRHAMVANCGGGSVAVLPIDTEGRPGEASDVVTVRDPACVAFDPAGRFAFACDRESDKVMVYRLDSATGKLDPADPPFVALPVGSRPRDVAFRPDGRFAYVLNEKTSTVAAFAYDAGTGRMKEIQSVSTLPGYWEGSNATAELGMHPSGKYLFASNRGHNSLALFTIEADGTLSWVEEQGTGAPTPRHFGIEPAGKHLAISNSESDKVLASRVDPTNGRLKPSGIFAEVHSPACIRFLPPQ
jgi:6-phosphogluconolactonase